MSALSSGRARYLEVVPGQFIERIEAFLDRWVRMNGELSEAEGGLPAKHHGVPTYVARFDCAPPTTGDEDPTELLYELEHDPGGIGMILDMERAIPGAEPYMGRALNALCRELGPIGLFKPAEYAHEALTADLEFMAKHLGGIVTSDPSALQDKFFFARGTSEHQPHSLRPRAITSGQNGKGFMPRLFEGRSYFADEAPAYAREGGVLKPTLGHWSQEVFTMPPRPKGEHDTVGRRVWDKRSTRATWEKAWARVAEDAPGSWIWQPFIVPGVRENAHAFDLMSPAQDASAASSLHFYILRLNFVFVPGEGWRFAGGVYTARPSLLVHGASNAVFGLVVRS